MKYLFIPIIFFSSFSGFAQEAKGQLGYTIEYVRTQNFSAAFPGDPAMEIFEKRTGSKIYRTYFTLHINGNMAIYKSNENNGEFNRFSETPGDDNMVITELNADTMTASKNVMGIDYLVKVPKKGRIKWKMTNEHIKIGGYDCIKVTGVMLDSIHIIAFFCPQIPIITGPESFTDLPGLILGVIILKENISWMAMNVDSSFEVVEMAENKRAKKISYNEFIAKLHQTIYKIPKYGPFLSRRALY